MTEETISQPQASQDVSTTPTLIVYGLYLLSMLTAGIAMFIGVVVAYVFKNDAELIQSHRQYQIRTFWIGLLYSLVCALTMMFGIGYLLLVAVVIWYVIRCVKGIKLLMEKKPISNAKTWWV